MIPMETVIDEHESEEGRRIGRLAKATGLAIGVGSSLGLNAVLSAVGYFSVHLGEGSFVLITCALYLPSLPMVLILSKLSSQSHHADRLGQLKSDVRSIIVTFVASAGALVITPFVKADLMILLAVCTLFSVCSAVAMEYSLQMVMLNGDDPQGCEQLKAMLFFGYQASSLICLGAKLATGFDPVSAQGVTTFFYALAGISLLLIAPTLYFAVTCAKKLYHQPLGSASSSEEEPMLEDSPLHEESTEEEVPSDSNGSSNTSDSSEEAIPGIFIPALWLKAFRQAELCSLTVFLTVLASMFVFPFYSFVPSSGGDEASQAQLASILFYAKTFTDALSRPATVVLPQIIRSRSVLLLVAVIRLAICVPLFFLYVFGNGVLPRNDAIFTIAIAIFAGTSGYLSTLSFQLLPVSDPASPITRQVSTIMNLSLQLAFFVAVGLAAIVCKIFELY